MISVFFISVGVSVFIKIMGTEFQPAIFVATPQANAKILRFFPSSKNNKTRLATYSQGQSKF